MNEEVADAFCNECASAFENWATCRIVFADLPFQTKLSDSDVLENPLGQRISRVYRMRQEALMS